MRLLIRIITNILILLKKMVNAYLISRSLFQKSYLVKNSLSGLSLVNQKKNLLKDSLKVAVYVEKDTVAGLLRLMMFPGVWKTEKTL